MIFVMNMFLECFETCPVLGDRQLSETEHLETVAFVETRVVGVSSSALKR